MKMSFEVYFFDLDGTLTDSSLGITNSIVYALNKMNEPIPKMDTLLKFIGPPLWESFEKFCGLSPERAKESVKFYREYYSEKGLYENKPYEHIPEVLEELNNKGEILAVATSKPKSFSVKILEYFDLIKYFKFIGGSNLDGTLTEKSEVIDHVIKMGKFKNKSKIIMIGDRKYDILGAKKNGIHSAGVLYGFGSLSELSHEMADFILSCPEDILKL